jgi:hypothetical protein
MQFDDDLKTVLITLAGLVTGWLLNELSSFIKSRRDENTVIKEVLHSQLNIWFLIRRTNIDFITKGMKEAVIKVEKVDDNDGLLDKVFRSFVESVLHELYSDSIKDIETKYKEKIENLARHYPILAYRIGDKQILYDYLNTIDKYFKKVQERFGEPVLADKKTESQKPQTNEETFEIIRDRIKPFVHKEALETIESDIKVISKRLGLVSYFRVKRLLKSAPEEKILKEYVDKIYKFIESFD